MQSPSLEFETEIWRVGETACGLDEVGRGCLAGPVVAAAVVFNSDHNIHPKVRDSKTLSAKQRQELFHFIVAEADDYGIGLVPAAEIDRIGIVAATKEAMRLAIEMLKAAPDNLLIDAVKLDAVPIKQQSIIKGDTLCYSISAASILAKVFRDQVVSGFDSLYPEYGFSSHKGYGARTHYEAIEKYGLTPEHRRTFLKKIM